MQHYPHCRKAIPLDSSKNAKREPVFVDDTMVDSSNCPAFYWPKQHRKGKAFHLDYVDSGASSKNRIA
jgi:hypothetical protein